MAWCVLSVVSSWCIRYLHMEIRLWASLCCHSRIGTFIANTTLSKFRKSIESDLILEWQVEFSKLEKVIDCIYYSQDYILPLQMPTLNFQWENCGSRKLWPMIIDCRMKTHRQRVNSDSLMCAYFKGYCPGCYNLNSCQIHTLNICTIESVVLWSSEVEQSAYINNPWNPVLSSSASSLEWQPRPYPPIETLWARIPIQKRARSHQPDHHRRNWHRGNQDSQLKGDVKTV